MENKIVRECVQGLIDDSIMIDTLCEQLQTERINLVQVVTDLDKGRFAFDIDKDINSLRQSLDSAINSVQDASMYADNARSEAENASDSAGYANDYIDDAQSIMRDIDKTISENNKKVEEEEAAETTCYDAINNPTSN